jgi:hypothetical protein
MFAFQPAQKLKIISLIENTEEKFFVAIIALNYLTNQIFSPFNLLTE